ncbi:MULTISPECIES: hypothetical protein [Hungatella]|uniref:hypothetical protein n=1 Tax=Hungatella TaxID=1649459 RepID=UPI002587A4E5|nr:MULTISPECIES: hypothetical protein [Hungatella]MCI6454848.1 hypothetical protein [Hungatella sp.]
MTKIPDYGKLTVTVPSPMGPCLPVSPMSRLGLTGRQGPMGLGTVTVNGRKECKSYA